MKIAICDDDFNTINFLKNKIQLQNNNDDITSFANASEMTPEIMSEFEIIFLDIEMPGIDGMGLAKLLRARQEDISVSPFGSLPLLIFVTGYKEYMGRAFLVHAFDYLLKPVSDEKFQTSYNRAKKFIENISDKNAVLSIKNAGKTYTIAMSDIKYVESQNRKNVIYFKSGDKLEYYGSMNELEKDLDGRFFRIHKGYIVNMTYIQKYDRTSVTVKSDEVLIMSKYRYQDFATAYMNYLRRKEGTI